MEQAGIPRTATVLWNAIPWWNGIVKVKAAEIREGAEAFKGLHKLLPNLGAVVMVGRKAAGLERYLQTTGLAPFWSDHPSPVVRKNLRERWEAIPSEWAKVRGLISLSDH